MGQVPEVYFPGGCGSRDLRNNCSSWRKSPSEPVSPRELSFKKGDTVYILRKIDQNWYEGEHHGRVGIFPISYVEVSPRPACAHEGGGGVLPGPRGPE